MAQPSWNVQTMPGSQFMELHGARERKLHDTRSGDALSARLRPFFPMLMGDELFFVVEHGGKIQGIGNYIKDGADFALSYISVDPEWRRQGIATAIVREAKRYLSEIGQTYLERSDYTEMGEQYLKRVIDREHPRAKPGKSNRR